MRTHADRASAVLLLVLIVLGLAVTATFAGGRAYRNLSHPANDRPDRPAFISAPDPILRAAKGLDPNSTDLAPGIARDEVHTVQVFRDNISLLAGGQLQKRIPLARPVSTLPDIVAAIGDPGWMRESAPGEIVLDAGLVMKPRTTLEVTGLRRVVLQTQPGVFIGGDEAELVFSGVTVEASDRAVPGDAEVGPGNRPFVVAQGGSMEVTDSTFRYLGRDWNDSYGVAWSKGATGFAIGSTFERCFTGVFAATAIDVRFQGNTMRDNTLNGFSAFEVSAGLSFVGNTVTGNGRGGVVLSSHVMRAELLRNTVSGNGFDGIQVLGSDQNVVRDNVSERNGGDGVTVVDGTGNTIEDNTLRSNRVALSAYGEQAGTNIARANTIDDNGLATQGLDTARNTVLSNGDYWRPGVLIGIWVAAAVIFLALLAYTRRCQNRRYRITSRSITDHGRSERKVLL